jgi:NADP-dependent 3-hydroxy acid dehydrogenase YdfG
MRLDGKIVIVTGGGSGIGRATARMLAAEGAQVVIAGRRKAPLDEVVAEVEKDGGRVVARQTDVANHEEALGLAEWTLATYSRVDVLVNNAGYASRVRSAWVERDEWDEVVEINLNAVYALTRAVLPGMVERGSGTIVTVTSLAGLKPGLISGAPYSAAKAAARNFMQFIHSTLRNKGIRATTIVPAEVDTPILDKRPFVPDADARGTMMQAEDVAAAILLCVTLPERTVVEEIVMSPTILRNQTEDLAFNARTGTPD